MKEAKDAMVMVAADYLSAYAQILTSSSKSATLLSPYVLRMVPLYMLSLIKSVCEVEVSMCVCFLIEFFCGFRLASKMVMLKWMIGFTQ
jgi:hypothetical protein